MNLTAPHEVVEIGEFSHIGHVNTEECLIVDDDGFIDRKRGRRHFGV